MMKRVLVALMSLLLVIFSPTQAYAFSFLKSQITGLNDATFNAQAGKFTSNDGTTSKVTFDNGGAVLSDYSSGQSLQCGGFKFVQGKNGVNIQAGNHVAITDPSAFIKEYSVPLYEKVQKANGFYIQKHYIHSVDIAGCSLTLDQAIAPSVKYQYVVQQLYGINSNNAQTSGNGYCLPNTNTLISNMAIDQYNRNGKYFLQDSSSPNYQINANCAGLYKVDVYFLVNGASPVLYKSSDWKVTPSSLQSTLNYSPVLPNSNQSNPIPDVWISK